MSNMTINISLPTSLYADARKMVEKRSYASISELVRDAVRQLIHPTRLTVNGFTPEFESEILRSEKDPSNWVAKWNGKGSFTEAVLKEGRRRRAKNRV